MSKNKFTKLDDNTFNELISNSKSIREILIKVNYCSNGSGGYEIFRRECNKRGIPIPKYEYYGNFIGTFSKENRLSDEDVFVTGSTYARQSLKRRILNDKLIEYKCSKCGNDGEWKYEKLTLQLEHKNGVNNDNRLENLCFLCPNCHSQTKTFAGKSKNKKISKNNRFIKVNYCECGKEIRKESKTCLECYSLSQRKVKRPEYEQLIKDIEELGYRGTGNKYGVSDNAIRKWKKKYENI
jgi:hypothetical protein